MNKVYSQIIHQSVNIVLKMVDPEFGIEFFVFVWDHFNNLCLIFNLFYILDHLDLFLIW